MNGWVLRKKGENGFLYWGVCNGWHVLVAEAYVFRGEKYARSVCREDQEVVAVVDGVVVEPGVGLGIEEEGEG